MPSELDVPYTTSCFDVEQAVANLLDFVCARLNNLAHSQKIFRFRHSDGVSPVARLNSRPI